MFLVLADRTAYVPNLMRVENARRLSVYQSMSVVAVKCMLQRSRLNFNARVFTVSECCSFDTGRVVGDANFLDMIWT